jgi:hypothetical protein
VEGAEEEKCGDAIRPEQKKTDAARVRVRDGESGARKEKANGDVTYWEQKRQ